MKRLFLGTFGVIVFNGVLFGSGLLFRMIKPRSTFRAAVKHRRN